MKLNKKHISSLLVHSVGTFPTIWKPPNVGILKINTDVSFTKGKIVIDIIIQNYLGIPYWQKPCLAWEDTLDTSSISFSHIYQIGNHPMHLLDKLVLATDQVL